MTAGDDEPAHTATLEQRAQPAPPLEDRFGRYRLEHALGEGGMGVVRDPRGGVDWQVLPAQVRKN